MVLMPLRSLGHPAGHRELTGHILAEASSPGCLSPPGMWWLAILLGLSHSSPGSHFSVMGPLWLLLPQLQHVSTLGSKHCIAMFH